ncbi:unnamed protein product, partial [Symbiodinium natans]
LAAWISSNFAAATYTAETNELDVTYDGVRLILNDAELRYLTISVQRFVFVQMNVYSELYLRCPSLANGETTVGPLRHDILRKMVVSKGVGHIMETGTSEGPCVNLRGPVTLRHLRFKLTDYEGNVVNTLLKKHCKQPVRMTPSKARQARQLSCADRFHELLLRNSMDI